MTQPVPPGMSGIPVRAPDGQAGTVPAGQIDAAIARGFRPLSPDELQAEQDREEALAATGGQAIAGVRGALRGFVPGYDAAVIEATRLLEGDESAARAARSLRASEAAYPTTSAVGEVAGMVAPNAAVTRVGQVAAGITGRVLPKATGLIARAGLETAAQVAVEGAIYGAGQGLSEELLGDPEANAEKLFAATGRGALFGLGTGAVLGSALGAAGGYVSRDARAVADAVGEARPLSEAEREAARVGTPAGEMADWDSRFAASEAAKGPKGPLESVVDSMAARHAQGIADPLQREAAVTAREAAKAIGDAEDAVQGITRRASKSADEWLSTMQSTREMLYGEPKVDAMTKLIDTPTPERSFAAIVGLRDTVRARLELASERLGKGEGNAAIRRALDIFDEFDRKMTKTIELGAQTIDDVRAGFTYLNRAKQELGAEAGFTREAITPSQKAIREEFYRVRGVLEDESLFGRGAVAQRETNAATTGMLETSARARALFIDATENVGGNVVLRADPKRLKGYFQRVDDVGADLERESLERFIAGHEAQIKAARETWPLTAAEEKMLQKAEAATAAFRAELVAAEDTARKASAAKRALEREQAGAIGGITGLIADGILRPATTQARLGEIARVARSADDRIREGIGRFLGGGGTRKPPRTSTATAEATKAGEEAARLAANPGALLGRVEAAFRGISEHAPQTATFLAQKATRVATYLASQAPKAKATSYSLTPMADARRYAEADVSRYARTHEAATDPIGYIERGYLTREGVQAIRELYPRLYADMRRQVIEDLSSRKTPLPYEQRIALGILVGVATDPTLDPSFVASIQATKQPQATPESAGGVNPQSSGRKARPLKVDAYQAPSDQIEART